MTEQQQTLSATQIREAGLGGWRQILGRVKARFRTSDLATLRAVRTTLTATNWPVWSLTNALDERPAVRVNQPGYLPGRPMTATVASSAVDRREQRQAGDDLCAA